MPRAATIQASVDGTLWALDRQTFRRIVLRNAFQKRKMYEALIEIAESKMAALRLRALAIHP